jgi:hypothetical protein
MSILLITSLRCRGGEFARLHGYMGTEYLQYRQVELALEGSGNAELSNLRAKFALQYSRGHKDVRNDSIVYHLRPLDDPQITHMCLIALFLIYTLRHGLVGATTLKKLLDSEAARADRRTV